MSEMRAFTEEEVLGLYGTNLAIGLTFGFLSGRNIKDAYESQARIQEILAEKSKLEAERDINYYNIKAATEGWKVQEQFESNEASQNVAMAASGFSSQSAGDKRLIEDTQAKAREYMRLSNKELSLASFERLKKAESEAIERKSLASQYRIYGKTSILTNMLKGASKSLKITSSGINFANTFFKDPNIIEQSPSTSSTSWEDIYGNDPVSDTLSQLNDSTFRFFNYKGV